MISTILAVIGLIATLIFGYLSVIFYRRSIRHRRLTRVYVYDDIQTRAHPEIGISFRGMPISNLSRLALLIWNSGTEPLRLSDFSKAQTPQLRFEQGSRVLSVAEIALPSVNKTLSTTQVDDKHVDFRFEYLNPQEGWWVEILYDRPTDAANYVLFESELIGGLISDWQAYSPRRPLKLIRDVALNLILSFITLGMGFMILREKTIWGATGGTIIIGLAVFLIGLTARDVYRAFAEGPRANVPPFAANFPSKPSGTT